GRAGYDGRPPIAKGAHLFVFGRQGYPGRLDFSPLTSEAWAFRTELFNVQKGGPSRPSLLAFDQNRRSNPWRSKRRNHRRAVTSVTVAEHQHCSDRSYHKRRHQIGTDLTHTEGLYLEPFWQQRLGYPIKS